MSISPLRLPTPAGEPWTAAARSAVADIAANALGIKAVLREGEPMPPGLEGALVPIVSAGLPPLQVGLFSTEEGCQGVARALLGMGPSDRLSRADVIDALNEVVNMMSGSMKARVPGYANQAALGLPTFVHGPIEHASGQAVDDLAVDLGAIRAHVVIIHVSR